MFTYIINEEDSNRAVVLFSGDIDIDGTEVMSEEIPQQLHGFDKVEFNFKDVHFLDSTGIGLFMKLVEGVKERETEVVITNINEDVNQLFTILQIPKILGEELFEEKEEKENEM